MLAKQREEMTGVGETALAGNETDRQVGRYEQMAGVPDTQLDEQLDQAETQVRTEQALERRRAGRCRAGDGVQAEVIQVIRMHEIQGSIETMVGAVGAWWSQTVMGESWGFGAEEGQDIELVTKGPFALVRNPIYTFMIFGTIGCLLMAPNAFTVMGWAVLLAAVQLLVRGVEEPHLIDSSANYRAYAATTGRFLPGIGKIS